MHNKQPCVYIMANKTRTMYVGVTSDLYSRVWQHKTGVNKRSFTARYGLTRLVHISEFSRMDDAIAFEKTLKGWVRQRKMSLVETTNPRWNDLAWNWYEDLLEG